MSRTSEVGQVVVKLTPRQMRELEPVLKAARAASFGTWAVFAQVWYDQRDTSKAVLKARAIPAPFAQRLSNYLKRMGYRPAVLLAALLLAAPASARTLDATPATLASALSSAAAGDTIRCGPGTYTTFPSPAREGVTVIGSMFASRFPGGSVWRSGTTLEDIYIPRGTGFHLDNWAGVSGVTLRRVVADLRNPGSTAFLMRWQPEGDARIRGLVVDSCSFTMTVTPGQPLDMKVFMFNRCVGTRARRSSFVIRDSSGTGGSSVRQGILFRDALVDNAFEACTLAVLAVHPNGQGYTGLDLTSSGNNLPGGGNAFRNCLIVQETDAYAQYQWCMQDGDAFEHNTVRTRPPFRISGVRGTASLYGNRFTSTGPSGVALIYGGSGITSGTLVARRNQFRALGGAAKSGISYESLSSAWDSDWNWTLNATLGQDVMIGGVRQSFAQACARLGNECGSTAIRTKGPVLP